MTLTQFENNLWKHTSSVELIIYNMLNVINN